MDESVNTVVIGAGASGLSMSRCLADLGVSYALLEQQEQVATPWRNHYDRLHLHSPKALSALPNQAWAADAERYPSRLAVVKYLEEYAKSLPHPPRFGQHVRRLERQPEGWRTRTDDAEYLSQNVVVATGHARVPHIPTWPGQEVYAGDRIHSSKYKNGDPWKSRRVLVVGFGNSACEIAIDLHERGARPTIAVRGGVNVIPRDLLGMPILGIGICLSVLPPTVTDLLAKPLILATVGNLRKLGLEKLPYGPNVQVRQHGRIPLLDTGMVALLSQGAIQVRPDIERFTKSGVVFCDGRDEDFAAVILGTGYRPVVSDLFAEADAVCSKDGAPRQSGTEVLPGLYFCGFRVSPTGMLREIAFESRRIARSIAESRRIR
ncbi:MAG: NAD(P)/FAD-dependent oxidoreductase [Burkholderiales bacterium]